jgi:hypothetical protein
MTDLRKIFLSAKGERQPVIAEMKVPGNTADMDSYTN